MLGRQAVAPGYQIKGAVPPSGMPSRVRAATSCRPAGQPFQGIPGAEWDDAHLIQQEIPGHGQQVTLALDCNDADV
jgi:hypothetical protein